MYLKSLISLLFLLETSCFATHQRTDDGGADVITVSPARQSIQADDTGENETTITNILSKVSLVGRNATVYMAGFSSLSAATMSIFKHINMWEDSHQDLETTSEILTYLTTGLAVIALGFQVGSWVCNCSTRKTNKGEDKAKKGLDEIL